MKKKPHKNILPLNDMEFKDDSKAFFSLSSQILLALIKDLEKKKLNFVNKKNLQILYKNNLSPMSIINFLFILSKINDKNIELIKAELFSIEIEKDKLDKFFDEIANISKETFDSVKTLINIISGSMTNSHLHNIQFDLTHKFLSIGKTPIILPMVNLQIETHDIITDEYNNANMNIDIINLQLLISSLESVYNDIKLDIEKNKNIVNKNVEYIINEE